MVNRGQIVKEKLKELGIKINSIAPKVGYGNIYIYRKLEKSNLEWDVIRKIGKAIDYDFSKDFPDMPFLNSENEAVGEPDSSKEYGTNKVINEVAYWKNKYIEVLERLNENLTQKKTEIGSVLQ